MPSSLDRIQRPLSATWTCTLYQIFANSAEVCPASFLSSDESSYQSTCLVAVWLLESIDSGFGRRSGQSWWYGSVEGWGEWTESIGCDGSSGHGIGWVNGWGKLLPEEKKMVELGVVQVQLPFYRRDWKPRGMEGRKQKTASVRLWRTGPECDVKMLSG